MSARTVIRWYWAGKPWNKPYKAEVVEGTEVLGNATLYATRDECVQAQTPAPTLVPLDSEPRVYLGRGDVLVSTTGSRWTVTKKWSQPDGAVWYRLKSTGGAYKRVMLYEITHWSKEVSA